MSALKKKRKKGDYQWRVKADLSCNSIPGFRGGEECASGSERQHAIGGYRFWLVCPGLDRSCDRRVTGLYRPKDVRNSHVAFVMA